jgi:Plavaka transposase
METCTVILHEALVTLLAPLKHAYKKGMDIVCTDQKTCWCYPVLATWLVDHMEYVKLFNIKPKSCPVCKVSTDQLDRIVEAKNLYLTQDYDEYYY